MFMEIAVLLHFTDYRCAYSLVASKDGHALAAKSRWPWMTALGNCTRSCRRSAISDCFCASVRVSLGRLPSAVSPPM